RLLAVAPTFALLLAACGSLHYDLSSVPIPISAKPAEPGAHVDPLHIESKNVLWVHGLFGQSEPDVTALVTEAAAGYDRIAGFRVVQSGSFHDWLLTHLSATLVRMKTVRIEGQLVRDE
ncbi:MAG: hypothetical protein KDB80_11340, partial [Planctomycetes bacterium]|nr:hypothetical protein [Planctomycetota bacterium]